MARFGTLTAFLLSGGNLDSLSRIVAGLKQYLLSVSKIERVESETYCQPPVYPRSPRATTLNYTDYRNNIKQH